ncbi:hypothetical protein ACU8MT_09225 [Rhizobium leguminosarum]
MQGLRPLSPARRLGMPSFHSAEPTLPPRPALLQVAIRRRHLPLSKRSARSSNPS